MKPKESIMKFAEAGIQGLETITGGGGECHRETHTRSHRRTGTRTRERSHRRTR
jgi:hypothetical protein